MPAEIEPTEPTAPAVNVPPLIRWCIYVAAATAAPAWAVTEANVPDLHWGWRALYAGWVAFSSTLAAANTRLISKS